MRLLLASALLMALTSATEAPDGKPNEPGCEAMVGVWEYVPPSAPGHAVIARQGTKYLGIFINTLAQSSGEQPKTPGTGTKLETTPHAYSVAGAWEYTCEATPSRLRLQLHWLYSSYRPQDVGSEVALEVERAGNQAKWWYIGPDGKRAAMGAGRLLR
jgi:hypothetical protein